MRSILVNCWSGLTITRSWKSYKLKDSFDKKYWMSSTNAFFSYSSFLSSIDLTKPRCVKQSRGDICLCKGSSLYLQIADVPNSISIY